MIPVSARCSLSRRHVLLAGAAGAGLWLAGCQPEPQPGGARPANQADALAGLMALVLPDLAGQQQALAQWAGQPLLINFWATWCAPCVHEMPDLDALQQAFPQVRFVGLGIDSLDNMRQFQARIPVRYPLLEARSVGLDLMRQLGNTSGGLPYTLLVSATGVVQHRVAGQIQPQALRQALQALV